MLDADLHGDGSQKSMCATTAYKQASLNAIACAPPCSPHHRLRQDELTHSLDADLKKLGYTLEQAYLLLSAAVRPSRLCAFRSRSSLSVSLLLARSPSSRTSPPSSTCPTPW